MTAEEARRIVKESSIRIERVKTVRQSEIYEKAMERINKIANNGGRSLTIQEPKSCIPEDFLEALIDDGYEVNELGLSRTSLFRAFIIGW